jgi:hypothetical protein
MPLGDHDARFRKVEEISEKCHQRFVGTAFDRRSLQGNLQPGFGAFAVNACDCCSLRSGLNSHCERTALRMVPQKALFRIEAHCG